MKMKGRMNKKFQALVAVFTAFNMTHATVNEALSTAFDIAAPYVEKEKFSVREDNWSGEIPAGEAKLIRHQLFRGNEYWFWLGSSFEDAEVKVEIFDGDGNPVGIESFAKGNKAGVRLLPQKTGTFFIRITVKAKKDTPKNATFDWGLVYGYR